MPPNATSRRPERRSNDGQTILKVAYGDRAPSPGLLICWLTEPPYGVDRAPLRNRTVDLLLTMDNKGPGRKRYSDTGRAAHLRLPRQEPNAGLRPAPHRMAADIRGTPRRYRRFRMDYPPSQAPRSAAVRSMTGSRRQRPCRRPQGLKASDQRSGGEPASWTADHNVTRFGRATLASSFKQGVQAADGLDGRAEPDLGIKEPLEVALMLRCVIDVPRPIVSKPACDAARPPSKRRSSARPLAA